MSYLQFELRKSRPLTVLAENICLSIRELLYGLIKQLANSSPQEGLLRGPMAVTLLKLVICAKNRAFISAFSRLLSSLFSILVPRAWAPFRQHQELRPLIIRKSNTGSPGFTSLP